MKKLFALSVFIFVSLLSCSNDNDAVAVNLDPNTALLQKTIIKNNSINEGEPVTTLWHYNGMKLVYTIDSNGLRRNYTYSGNLITKVEEINGGSSKIYMYGYNAENQLVAINGDITDVFTYNSDGTITDDRYYTDKTLQSTSIIHLTGGEISRIERTYPDGFSTVQEYTYDNQLSPTKNIVGFDKIYLNMNYPSGRLKNVATRSYSDSEGTSGSVHKTLTYNPIGFPIAIHSEDDQMIDSFEAQFFYQ